MINYVYLDINNNNNQFGIEKMDKLCLFIQINNNNNGFAIEKIYRLCLFVNK